MYAPLQKEKGVLHLKLLVLIISGKIIYEKILCLVEKFSVSMCFLKLIMFLFVWFSNSSTLLPCEFYVCQRECLDWLYRSQVLKQLYSHTMNKVKLWIIFILWIVKSVIYTGVTAIRQLNDEYVHPVTCKLII